MSSEAKIDSSSFDYGFGEVEEPDQDEERDESSDNAPPVIELLKSKPKPEVRKHIEEGDKVAQMHGYAARIPDPDTKPEQKAETRGRPSENKAPWKQMHFRADLTHAVWFKNEMERRKLKNQGVLFNEMIDFYVAHHAELASSFPQEYFEEHYPELAKSSQSEE